VLEEVPDITYADVGGLDIQIESITDAVSCLPAPQALQHLQAARPEGHPPLRTPGCGKTLIAKAVANSLAKKVAQVTGNTNVRSYFLNIKARAAQQIRGETSARSPGVPACPEKAEEGVPVIVFFDEMDSLFRTRAPVSARTWSRPSCPSCSRDRRRRSAARRDRHRCLQPGRPDRPAILRPGRLDVKIKIERPNEEAAAQIFSRT